MQLTKKSKKKKKFTTFQELYADPVITSLKKGKALNPQSDPWKSILSFSRVRDELGRLTMTLLCEIRRGKSQTPSKRQNPVDARGQSRSK